MVLPLSALCSWPPSSCIIGIGTDLIDIRRIERIIDRYGQRFVQYVFTEAEQAYANKKHQPAMSYAKRFAAKEAVSKAAGQGIGQNLFWKDIEVDVDDMGKPSIKFSGKSQRWLCGKNFTAVRGLLSLSDEYPYAQAFVMLLGETERKDENQ